MPLTVPEAFVHAAAGTEFGGYRADDLRKLPTRSARPRRSGASGGFPQGSLLLPGRGTAFGSLAASGQVGGPTCGVAPREGHGSPVTPAPKLSVIVCVRNGRRFLERALRSIERQDVAPDDHVLVDGASTDGTLEIARRFAQWRRSEERRVGKESRSRGSQY